MKTKMLGFGVVPLPNLEMHISSWRNRHWKIGFLASTEVWTQTLGGKCRQWGGTWIFMTTFLTLASENLPSWLSWLKKSRCSSSAHKIQLIYIRHRLLLIKHVYYDFGLLNKHTSSLSAQAIIILKGHKSAQGPNFLDTKSRHCNRQNGRTICYFSHQCFY